MAQTPGSEFWRELKPVVQVVRPGAIARGIRRQRGYRRRALLRAAVGDGRHQAAVDISEPEPLV
jgi:hypothetical protein